MIRLIALLGLLLLALPIEAQPGCESILLPDLGPVAGTQTAVIETSVGPVPPVALTGTLVYPFNLTTTADGTVTVTQTVGDPSKLFRQWTGIRSVSLVSWYSAIHGWQWPTMGGPFYVGVDAGGNGVAYDPGSELIRFFGYKTLPHVPTADGSEATWAYRTTQMVTDRRTNMNLSLPVQLGEGWNVGVYNGLSIPISADLQVEARLCR